MNKEELKEFWPIGHKVPDWLPDWRYDEEYPNIKKARKQDFAWEFLRRNIAYQGDYDKISAMCDKEGILGRYQSSLGFSIFPNILEPTKPPKSIKFHAELYRTLAKWGLSYLLPDPAHGISHSKTMICEYCPQEEDDPKLTPRNRYVSLNIEELAPDHQRRYKPVPGIDSRYDVDLNFMGRIGLFNHSIVTVNDDNQNIPVDGGIIPTEDEVPYLFDLSLPIKPQIEAAEKLLKESQKLHHGKNVGSSKTSMEHYPIYLRLLDADASGASHCEIRTTLFSGKRYTALDDARDGAYPLLEENYKLLF